MPMKPTPAAPIQKRRNSPKQAWKGTVTNQLQVPNACVRVWVCMRACIWSGRGREDVSLQIAKQHYSATRVSRRRTAQQQQQQQQPSVGDDASTICPPSSSSSGGEGAEATTTKCNANARPDEKEQPLYPTCSLQGFGYLLLLLFSLLLLLLIVCYPRFYPAVSD